MSCSYNPHNLCSAHYENIILLGDFNVNTNDPCMKFFCNLYRFRSLTAQKMKFYEVNDDEINTEFLDLFFSNAVKNLNIPVILIHQQKEFPILCSKHYF